MIIRHFPNAFVDDETLYDKGFQYSSLYLVAFGQTPPVHGELLILAEILRYFGFS
jgi:hypothetical protein